MSARILGAADLALLRAREAAGNRLKSLAKRDPESAAIVKGLPAGRVAAALGPERVRALGIPEQELVAAAASLITDALRVWDIADGTLTALIIENVEKHAARTLYEDKATPLPSSFTNYIVGLTDLPPS